MIEKIEINLLPAEYRIRKKSFKIPRAIIYPILLLIIMAAVGALYTMHLKEREAELNNNIEKITKEIQANRHIQSEINRLREEMKVTDEKIRALEQITVDKEKWVRLLEALSSALPSYTWLVSVREDPGPPGRLTVEARTYSFPEVAEYMVKLEKHDYITSVELTGIDQMQMGERQAFRFNLICALNPNAGIRAAPAAADTVAAPAPAANESAGGRRRGRR